LKNHINTKIKQSNKLSVHKTISLTHLRRQGDITFLKHHSWRGEGALFYKERKNKETKLSKKKIQETPDNFK
jgi:hypothetical protein